MEKMIREPLGIDESSLKHVCFLGMGSYGFVSLKQDSNFRLHAKKSSASFNHLKNLQKELRIMLYFRNHPRIVQASSSAVNLTIEPKGCHFYMEFASKGSLLDMISQFRGKPMPEDMIRRAALMILQGLDALHSHGYVHCDLKPENVLVFPSTTIGEPWDLKLADFGLSKEPSTDSRSLFPGTEEYMPPESFGPDGDMGPDVDIWSLGCVVVEMFGACPEKMRECYVWRLPKLISPVANDFLKRCMALQPSRRDTAAKLLSHPFVAQRDSVPMTVTLRSDIMDKVLERYSRTLQRRMIV